MYTLWQVTEHACGFNQIWALCTSRRSSSTMASGTSELYRGWSCSRGSVHASSSAKCYQFAHR